MPVIQVIKHEFTVDDVLTDPDNISVSDVTATFGVRETKNKSIVIADGAGMTKISDGIFETSFVEPDSGLTYDVSIQTIHLGVTVFTTSTIEPNDQWVTQLEADNYFATRTNAATYWTSGNANDSTLIDAQRQIVNSDEFTLFAPLSGETVLTAIKEAICEQALFLLQASDSVDKREALQAMGVASAQVVGETYGGLQVNRISIAPRARQALAKFRKHGLGFKYNL